MALECSVWVVIEGPQKCAHPPPASYSRPIKNRSGIDCLRMRAHYPKKGVIRIRTGTFSEIN